MFYEDPKPKPFFCDRFRSIFSSSWKNGIVEFAKQNILLQYAQIHSITDDKYNVFYLKNSKSGCTKIAHTIFFAKYGYCCKENIHTTIKLDQGYRNWQSAQSAINDPDYYKFSVVRNPLDRVVSAFTDFIIEKKNKSWTFHYAPFIEYELLDQKNSIANRFSNFIAFLTDYTYEKHDYVDRHFRSQYKNLAVELIDYTFIFRLEEIDSWLVPLISDIYKVKLPVGFSDKRVNSSSKLGFTPSKDDVLRIEKLYARDFEIFEYAHEKKV